MKSHTKLLILLHFEVLTNLTSSACEYIWSSSFYYWLSNINGHQGILSLAQCCNSETLPPLNLITTVFSGFRETVWIVYFCCLQTTHNSLQCENDVFLSFLCFYGSFKNILLIPSWTTIKNDGKNWSALQTVHTQISQIWPEPASNHNGESPSDQDHY